jgi:hypothetical protein
MIGREGGSLKAHETASRLATNFVAQCLTVSPQLSKACLKRHRKIGGFALGLTFKRSTTSIQQEHIGSDYHGSRARYVHRIDVACIFSVLERPRPT